MKVNADTGRQNVRIEYDGIWAQLVLDSPSESIAFEITRTNFSVLDENRFMSKSFPKYWDGRHHMIDAKGFFLRGMTEEVIAYLGKNGIVVPWVPYYAPHPQLAQRALTENLSGIDLWEHQRRMTKALLVNGGGTVEGVTGSGKTESIALLMKLLLEDPRTDVILFLVHLVGLADQTKKRLEKRSPSLRTICGLMADGDRPDTHHRIVFSTYQSVLSALGMRNTKVVKKPEPEFVEMFSKVSAIIIDECHHASQDEYVKLVELRQGIPVYQFSGTPEVDDPLRDWAIKGLGGPILERVRRPELEKKGIIAVAVACLREFPNIQKKRKRIDWVPEKRATSYFVDAMVIDKDGNAEPGHVTIDPEKGMLPLGSGLNALLVDYARDSIILDMDRTYDMLGFCRECVKMGRNVVVLCERVAQVLFVYGIFKKEFKVAYVHGEDNLKTRLLRKEEFSSGKINVLIASSIFDEGEDVDNVGAVALASGGSSLVKLVQRIGRGVRGKQNMGNWIPIWCPVDSRNKYTKEHTIQRLEYLDRASITCEEAIGPWGTYLPDLAARMDANVNSGV